MAEGLNRVMIIGNLGADPELKVLQSGQAKLAMRIATTESYLDRDNTRKEKTEWHSVVVWGRRAEALAKYLSKGTRIFVEGKLQTSSWEKDGEKRYRTEIVGDKVLFMNARNETERTASRTEDRPPGRTGEGRPSASGGGSPPAAPPQDDFGDYAGGGYDGLPF